MQQSSPNDGTRLANVCEHKTTQTQLFSYRIGQAQTIEGARITSTNTDGLYSVLDPEINNPILERESAQINVDIEPEPLILISKDTNNRIELNEPKPDNKRLEMDIDQKYAIMGASGGTLSCRQGPVPTKSLAHPAIIDWAATEYLIKAGTKSDNVTLEKPFDEELGLRILTAPITDPTLFQTKSEVLRMFQNVLASSDGSQMYNFAMRDDDPNPIDLQHYNRVFIMKDKTPNTYHLSKAVVRTITDATIQKRRKDDELPQQHDEMALKLLKTQGITRESIPDNKEAAISKITNIEDTWYMRIENRDLSTLSNQELDEITQGLDIDKYLTLFKDCFEKNWRNASPEYEQLAKEEKEQAAKAKAKAKTPKKSTKKSKKASTDDEQEEQPPEANQPEPQEPSDEPACIPETGGMDSEDANEIYDEYEDVPIGQQDPLDDGLYPNLEPVVETPVTKPDTRASGTRNHVTRQSLAQILLDVPYDVAVAAFKSNIQNAINFLELTLPVDNNRNQQLDMLKSLYEIQNHFDA